MVVRSIDIHVTDVIESSKIPPSSLKGRQTAAILCHTRINQPCPSHCASSTRRCRRIKVLSSRVRVSNSRRSFEDNSSGFPPQRPSSCRCRSRFTSSCCAVVARNVRLEVEGAVLMRLIGSSARPGEVYKTYRQRPRVIKTPSAKVNARSPSASLLAFLR